MAKDSMIHPDKQRWIEAGGDAELQQLLPSLSSTEKSYLETVTSDSYAQLVARLEKYTGIHPEKGNLPRIIALVMQTLSSVVQAESPHKKELQDLAVEFVLNMDEFKMVREAYENQDVRFEVQLKEPDIELVLPQKSGDLFPEEEANIDLEQGLDDVSEFALKRRLADLLTQGSAVLKTYSFHLLEDKLSKIDGKLINWYGILAVAAQLGYWVTPDGLEKLAARGEAKVGAEEVVAEGDEYVIRAQAVTLPYLIHELVKGIYSWISIKPEFSQLKPRGVSGETSDIIVGPEVVKQIQGMIPVKKQYLVPLVNKKLLDLTKDQIHAILLNTPKGQQIIAGLIRDAENDWEEYQKSQREAEYEEEYGDENPEGPKESRMKNKRGLILEAPVPDEEEPVAEPEQEEPEEEGVLIPTEVGPESEIDIEKIYLGKSDDTNYYVVSRKNEAGAVEDLQVVDQVGNVVISAKEQALDIGDVANFILGAIEDDALKGSQLERAVVMQYLVPKIEQEQEEEEKPAPRESKQGYKKPRKRVKKAATKESKEASGMLIEDGKGNKFSVQLVDEGASNETIVSINGREFHFHPSMVEAFAEDGQVTDESLKEIALQTIQHLDGSDYAELVGMGVQESKTNEDWEQESDEEGVAGADQIPGGLADKDGPDELLEVYPDEILRGLAIEMEHTDDPQKALEIAMDHLTEDPRYYTHLDRMEQGKCDEPGDETEELKLEDEEMEEGCGKKHMMEEQNSFQPGDVVQIEDEEGNTTIVPRGVVSEVDEVLGDDGEMHTVVELSGSENEDEQEWYRTDEYQIILLKKANEGKVPLDSDSEDKKIKLLYEDVLELVGEVDWMEPSDVRAVRNAIASGKIENEWPSEDEMINALSGLEDVINPHTEPTDQDLKMSYLRHILVPKAISMADVGAGMEGEDMEEREGSDMMGASSFKEVFQVQYMVDSGEEKMTRVMAYDKDEAGRMISRQKGVKSVMDVHPVKEEMEEGKVPLDSDSEDKKINLLYEWVDPDLEKRNQAVFDGLVPVDGPARTVEGETLRAANQIAYRFFNDGDVFYSGYGIETAGPAYEYLKNMSEQVPGLRDVLVKMPKSDKEEYEKDVNQLLRTVLDYIESRKGQYHPNTDDMWNYEDAAIQEFGEPSDEGDEDDPYFDEGDQWEDEEEEFESRAQHMAEALLGLSNAVDEEDEELKIGDHVQIVKRDDFECMVVEAIIRRIDEQKGVEITGQELSCRQQWFSPKYYRVFKL